MSSIAGGRLPDPAQARTLLAAGASRRAEHDVARTVESQPGDGRLRISRISHAATQSAHAAFSYGRSAVPESGALPGSHVDTYA